MHDAGVVVGNGERVHLIAAVTEKFCVSRADHVLPENSDVVISVGPRLFVEETERVAYFVE